jgi:hypothetical protein
MQDTQNRRGPNRLLCAELVELSWLDQSGRSHHRVANLEDISLSGVCLQVESPIPSGTSLSVSYGDGELLGTVRYCRYEGMGYFLGVELADGCRWSSQHYRPEHLLDPHDLVEQAVQRHHDAAVPVQG